MQCEACTTCARPRNDCGSSLTQPRTGSYLRVATSFDMTAEARGSRRTNQQESAAGPTNATPVPAADAQQTSDSMDRESPLQNPEVMSPGGHRGHWKARPDAGSDSERGLRRQPTLDVPMHAACILHRAPNRRLSAQEQSEVWKFRETRWK